MQQRINLVPRQPLAERIKALIPLVFGTMLLLLGLIFFSWVQILNLRLIDLDKNIARIEEESSQQTALRHEITVLQKRLQGQNQGIDRKTAQIATLSKIKGHKRKFSKPLTLIAALLPESVRCKTITFKEAQGEIKGTARDYNDLIGMVRSMQQVHVFKKVSLSVTDRTSGKEEEWIEFTLIVELV